MINIKTATSEEMAKVVPYLKFFSSLNQVIYRWTGGRLMGKLGGRDVMLVTMTGAKSGKSRVIPLMHVPYKEGVIIVASLGGAPGNPVWFNNLVVNPDIEVQYKSNKMSLRARRATDEEKKDVWPICCEHYPEYDVYQKRTERNIPVFIAEPR
jgi:deazaflavin-dependent oxidoreductase (nitroreductase family)